MARLSPNPDRDFSADDDTDEAVRAQINLPALPFEELFNDPVVRWRFAELISKAMRRPVPPSR
jgi:hypothetical protein